MQTTSEDAAALQAYVERRCEDSFGRLVSRYLPLVYSVALRRVAGAHALAEEIAQVVFTDLARKAPSLPPDFPLGGWLHRHTCFVSSKTIRSESRRRTRENSLAALAPPDSSSDPWNSLQPVVDELLDRLPPDDRHALILRFFEGSSFTEIARALRLTEAAAQKRTHRAIEKLRDLIAARPKGLSLTSTALGSILVANASVAVPAQISSSIAASACAAATATVTTLPALLTMSTITKTKIAALGALAVGLTIPITLQHRSVARLQSENSLLRQELAGAAQLHSENQQLRQTANDRELTSSEFAELLRLRGEVTLLRQKTNELAALSRNTAQPRSSQPPPARSPQDQPVADIAAARELIFAPAATVDQKLEALRLLRSADARTDDVVRQMVQVYYNISDPAARADIFRQLHGVATPELKQPLLEAISDPSVPDDVREEAAESLDAFVSDEKVHAWLQHTAANDPNPQIRRYAARSLESAQAQPPK